jgi:hypothetical protein
MDEVKNMLDYKVGHYLKSEDIASVDQKNPNGDMDKLKARLVADGSQQGRHLYDFISSATVSLLVNQVFSIPQRGLSSTLSKSYMFCRHLLQYYYSPAIIFLGNASHGTLL